MGFNTKFDKHAKNYNVSIDQNFKYKHFYKKIVYPKKQTIALLFN